MILDWPEDLPPPERGTWQSQRQEARRGRRPDAGPPAWRRRFSSVARIVQMSLLLTRSQKAVFDRFFAIDCAEGTHLFRMPDPTTEGWPVLTADGAEVLLPDGRPALMSATWLCRWGEAPPVETLVWSEFRMSFSIVVLP